MWKKNEGLLGLGVVEIRSCEDESALDTRLKTNIVVLKCADWLRTS